LGTEEVEIPAPREPVAADHAVVDLAEAADAAVRLFQQEKFKRAAAMFEQVLGGCENVVGPEHPATLTVSGNLGVALVSAGRRRDGIARIEANVQDRARVLGREHPDTLTARDALATAYRLNGDVDLALELAKRVTAQRTRLLGATHPDTLTSRMGQICAITAAGDMSAGLELLRDAMQDAEDAHGLDHRLTRAVLECGQHAGLIHASKA
jgi:Tetratricopeptide repeat